MTITAESIVLFTSPEEAEARLASVSDALAEADEAPPDVLEFAEELGAQLIQLQRGDWPAIDPYLLAELMQTVAAVEQTLRSEDPKRQCAELEIEVEALRDINADLRDAANIRDDRPAIEVARWLKETTQASYQELSFFGPSKRTWERWLSPTSSAEPHGEDEARIRVAARIVNQLRHALTARGVLRWFVVGHPELGGQPPAALLADLANAQRLVALASEIRRSDAA
jgi:hypothetical protein